VRASHRGREHRFYSDVRRVPNDVPGEDLHRQEGGQDAKRVGGPGGRGEREEEGDEKTKRQPGSDSFSRASVWNILFSMVIAISLGTTFPRSEHLTCPGREKPVRRECDVGIETERFWFAIGFLATIAIPGGAVFGGWRNRSCWRIWMGEAEA